MLTSPRTPLWRSIAGTLRAEIAGGHYRAGDKLPTEVLLATRFGVNRHTVRHALADLATTGTVHARRGSGVFVASVPTDYPLGRRVRFHQNVLASGRTPSRQILRIEARASNPREAAALGLAPGDPVHVLEGLTLADGVPLATFRSVFPLQRFPDLPAAITRLQSITQALAEAGVHDYTRQSTRLTAKAADALLARHLRIAEGAPVLRSVAVNADPAGRPVEYGTTWFAGDRTTLTVNSDSAGPWPS